MNKGQGGYAFRNNAGRTRLVQFLAALVGLSYLAAGLLPVGAAVLGKLGWLELSAAGLLRLLDAVELAGWAAAGLFAASGLAFLAWLHRAAGNARALGAVGMQVSPDWAVGGFFVPIVNLFLPYQALREIRANGAADSEPEGWLLKVWWFGLLGNMGLNRFWQAFGGEEQADAGAWLLFIALSSGLMAASAYALLRLAGEIERRQNVLAAGRGFR